MKRITAIILTVCMLIGMLTGCAAEPTSPNPPADADTPVTEPAPAEQPAAETDEKKVIAYVANSMDEYNAEVSGIYQRECDARGWEYMVLNSDNSVDMQLTHIENLVEMDVDCIIMRAVEADGIIPAVDVANAAGIPIINVELDCNADVSAYLKITYQQVGAGQWKWIKENVLDKDPEATLNVLYIIGDGWDNKTYKGFQAAYDEAVEYHDRVKILDVQSGGLGTDDAMTLMESWMQVYRDEANCVIAESDAMIKGAILALQGEGIDPSPYTILAYDGQELGLEMIRNGELDATGVRRYKTFIDTVMYYVEFFLEGNELPPDERLVDFSECITFIDMGNYEMITAENAGYVS